MIVVGFHAYQVCLLSIWIVELKRSSSSHISFVLFSVRKLPISNKTIFLLLYWTKSKLELRLKLSFKIWTFKESSLISFNGKEKKESFLHFYKVWFNFSRFTDYRKENSFARIYTIQVNLRLNGAGGKKYHILLMKEFFVLILEHSNMLQCSLCLRKKRAWKQLPVVGFWLFVVHVAKSNHRKSAKSLQKGLHYLHADTATSVQEGYKIIIKKSWIFFSFGRKTAALVDYNNIK